MTDNSPSSTIGVLLFTAHIFRMSLFFFVAGVFARMLFHRGGARGFWANRSKRILVPLVAGWPIIFPVTAAVWVWGLTRTFGGTLPPAPANAPAPPPGTFPWTHLWFLYYLLVLYAIVLAIRAAFGAIDRSGSLKRAADASVRRLVHSGDCCVAMALPVALALFFRREWIAWFGIPTPDHSVIPELASLVGYGSALSFGWMIHRQADLLTVWARQWPMHLAAAVIGTAVCLSLAGIAPAWRSDRFWRREARPRARLLAQYLVLVARHSWHRHPVPLTRQCHHPVRGRCLLLDLPGAPAGRRGAAGGRRPAALALDDQVSIDSRRQPGRAVRELSIPRSIDVRRSAAERPQVPEIDPACSARGRRGSAFDRPSLRRSNGPWRP